MKYVWIVFMAANAFFFLENLFQGELLVASLNIIALLLSFYWYKVALDREQNVRN